MTSSDIERFGAIWLYLDIISVKLTVPLPFIHTEALRTGDLAEALALRLLTLLNRHKREHQCAEIPLYELGLTSTTDDEVVQIFQHKKFAVKSICWNCQFVVCHLKGTIHDLAIQ
jgi:hypothetical protein